MNFGTVCVTGATSGIGRAYARALADRGHALILTGRREEALREFANELDTPVEVITGDLRDPATCTALGDRLAACRDLVMLIHNAGYGHRAPFMATSPGELREMGELHMQCSAVLLRAAVPAITDAISRNSTDTGRPGRRAAPPAVILVSSLAAFTPAPGSAMYTSTKAYQITLARALQPELVSRGIRAQVLCPGFTHTDFHDRLDWSADRRRNRGIVRWMHAEDVVGRSLRRLDRAPPRANPVYVPGFSNRVILALLRLMPHRLYLALSGRADF